MKALLVALLCFTLSSASAQAPTSINPTTTTIKISNNKVTTLVGPIDNAMLMSVSVQLRTTRDVPGDRVFLIHSPGGSLSSGRRIIELMHGEQVKGVKITCVVIGMAHSMAFIIMNHCDTRLALEGASMVAHKASIGQPDERMTAKNMRMWADELDEINEEMAGLTAMLLRLTLDEYDKRADEDYSWSTSELLANGYLSGLTTLD